MNDHCTCCIMIVLNLVALKDEQDTHFSNDSSYTYLPANRMSQGQQISLPHSNKNTAYIVYKMNKEILLAPMGVLAHGSAHA